ncbi:MAG: DUF3106 domain-containing protein [Burkholderiales bacterium]
MTPEASRWPRGTSRGALAAAILVVCVGALCWAATSAAQSSVASGPARAAAKLAPEQGVRWRDLKPGQQAVLKPLEREWPGITAGHKDKWIELSGGFSKRPVAEQERIQERMTEWARLTTQERSQARLNFQEAKQLPLQDRKARWDEYQALSPEKKKQLAARAAPASNPAALKPAAPRGDATQAKSNVVPNPALSSSPKVIAPTVVQARPGATTTLITKRPTPPSHQQAGLPKIAATPEFVNKATLLPQRGPQGAATRSAEAPASEHPTKQ